MHLLSCNWSFVFNVTPVFYGTWSLLLLDHKMSYSYWQLLFASRSTESLPSWDDEQRSFLKNYDTQAQERPSAVTSFVVSRNSGTSVTAKIARFQDTKGARSPPFMSKDENIRNSIQGVPTR